VCCVLPAFFVSDALFLSPVSEKKRVTHTIFPDQGFFFWAFPPFLKKYNGKNKKK